MAMLAPLLWSSIALQVAGIGLPTYSSPSQCDDVHHGYQCKPEVSHFWGQYSPFFSVPSTIPTDVPLGCEISFVQVLSRHGARDPTASKTSAYNRTVQKIKSTAKSFNGRYAFLANYTYTLGADQLTAFGVQEMVNSGVTFHDRYQALASRHQPFVRASGEARVVDSARNWTYGYELADSKHAPSNTSYPILVIPEADGSNNTLNHGLCQSFEDGPDSKIASAAQAIWVQKFVPPIQSRLNTDLPGVNLSSTDVISIMDLCPFETVASSNGTISPFCNLFSEQEWHQYNYYETLGKYYGYSYGNPLGPTQGVGFVNELIARMTNQSVHDNTTSNRTLDSNPSTFPLGLPIYADFSHDNDMTGVFSALQLYNNSKLLPNDTIVEAQSAAGYSAAWTVPFAARAYFEKMKCIGYREELVRVIVNDRVVPSAGCSADILGRCSLTSFVNGLSFARSGGKWADCFK